MTDWVKCDDGDLVSDSKGKITGQVWIASSHGFSHQHEYENEVFTGYYDSCGGYTSEEFSGHIVAVARCEAPEFPKELVEGK